MPDVTLRVGRTCGIIFWIKFSYYFLGRLFKVGLALNLIRCFSLCVSARSFISKLQRKKVPNDLDGQDF